MIWSNSFDNAIAISASKTFEALPSVFKEIIISFSTFGDNGIFFILAGILLLFFVKTRKLGLTLLLACVFTLLINDLILKNIFDRARPFEDPALVKDLISIQNNNGLPYGIIPTSNSFPSGHSFTSFFAAGGVLSLYIFDKEERKNYLAPLIYFSIFAVFMGACRILLSHHYCTDVIAGALIGFAFGLLTYIILKYLYILFFKVKDKIQARTKGE